jgi:hypothetical protein
MRAATATLSGLYAEERIRTIGVGRLGKLPGRPLEGERAVAGVESRARPLGRGPSLPAPPLLTTWFGWARRSPSTDGPGGSTRGREGCRRTAHLTPLPEAVQPRRGRSLAPPGSRVALSGERALSHNLATGRTLCFYA